MLKGRLVSSEELKQQMEEIKNKMEEKEFNECPNFNPKTEVKEEDNEEIDIDFYQSSLTSAMKQHLYSAKHLLSGQQSILFNSLYGSLASHGYGQSMRSLYEALYLDKFLYNQMPQKNAEKIKLMLDVDSEYIKDEQSLISFYFYINNKCTCKYLDKYKRVKFNYSHLNNLRQDIEDTIITEGDIEPIIDRIKQVRNEYSSVEKKQLQMLKMLDFKIVKVKSLTKTVLFLKESLEACEQYKKDKLERKPKIDSLIELIVHTANNKIEYKAVRQMIETSKNKDKLDFDCLIKNIKDSKLKKEYRQKRLEEKLKDDKSEFPGAFKIQF